MADEQNIDTTSNGGAKNTSTTDVAVKKTRAPRRPKNTADAVANAENVITDKPAKKTRAKRGSKVVETKGPKASRASNRPVSTANSTATSQAAVVDEFADLLALEEENRSLRKQLAEKLRAENADLRKRLG